MTYSFTMERVNQELAKERIPPFPEVWASKWLTRSSAASLLLVFLATFFQVLVIPFASFSIRTPGSVPNTNLCP